MEGTYRKEEILGEPIVDLHSFFIGNVHGPIGDGSAQGIDPILRVTVKRELS